MAMEDANASTDILPNSTLDTAPVQRAPLNPVAQPTPIRFSPPALAHDSSLESLAQGLKNFDAGLSDYMDAKQAKQNDADKVQAQADFLKNNQKGYADAVASGTIPASASPLYVQTYKEEQGKVAGQMLEQKFQAAYEAWPGKNNLDDPTAYSKWAQGWISQNVGTNDPYVLKGLLPVIHDFMEHGLHQNIANQSTNLKQGFGDAQSASMTYDISKGVAFAKTSGQDIPAEYIARVVGDAYDKAKAVGVTDEEAQKRAIVTITTQALQNKDGFGEQILKGLDAPLPGSGLVLSSTPFGAEQKTKIGQELDTYQREKVLHITEQERAANKAALGSLEGKVIEQLAKDPTAVISEDDLKEGQKYDGTFRYRVAQWQDGFLKNEGTSDPETLRKVEMDIMAGKGADSIALAIESRAVTKPSDISELLKMQKDHDTASGILDKVKREPQYQQVYDQIGKNIQLQTSDTGLSDPSAALGISNAGMGLRYELDKRMEEWAAANPNASNQDARDQLNKTWIDLQKMITQPASKSDAAGPTLLPQTNPYFHDYRNDPNTNVPRPGPIGPYPQQQQAGGAQPSPSSSTSTTPGQPPTATPAPAPAADPATHAAAQEWFRTLSPTQQSTLNQHAATAGMPPDQYLAQTFQKLQAAGKLPQMAGATNTGLAPNTFNPSSTETRGREADSFTGALAKWQATDPNAPAVIHQLMGTLQGLHAALPYRGVATLAAIKDNPQAGHLLDFVAGPESNGNYNAYFAHADNQTTKLTDMSLKEVLQFQHNLVAVDGLPSSASGRYQFMPDTLKGLMTQMRLTGDERFTPEMQDNLALQLLKNRGLESWQQGKLSDVGFMQNLSQEWASLPNPHTGASWYDKDGLNKSLVTTGQVAKVLSEAKGMPTTAAAATPAAPSATPAAPAVAPTATDLGVPTPPPPHTQSNRNAGSFVVGDSIGDGVRAAIGGVGDTKVSRQPTNPDPNKGVGLGVLETIQKMPAGSLAGKSTVILSTGLSNNASANVEDVVGKQVQALIAKGANPAAIRILGVGDRPDYTANKLNDRLMALAAKTGAQFVPLGRLPAGEHVHPDPSGYADIGSRAQSKIVNTAASREESGSATTEE